MVNWQQEEPNDFNGRRQPSRSGTSRISREAYVRFCERLGVKLPGPTWRSGNGTLCYRARSRLYRRGPPVYAGFELELAGAERYRKRETRDDTESAATNVLTGQCIFYARSKIPPGWTKFFSRRSLTCSRSCFQTLSAGLTRLVRGSRETRNSHQGRIRRSPLPG